MLVSYKSDFAPIFKMLELIVKHLGCWKPSIHPEN